MTDLLGFDIPPIVRGLVYLCEYANGKLTPFHSIMCDDAFDAIQLFAEIPNPASQIATGQTQEDFEEELTKLHNHMLDPVWQKQLAEYL